MLEATLLLPPRLMLFFNSALEPQRRNHRCSLGSRLFSAVLGVTKGERGRGDPRVRQSGSAHPRSKVKCHHGKLWLESRATGILVYCSVGWEMCAL